MISLSRKAHIANFVLRIEINVSQKVAIGTFLKPCSEKQVTIVRSKHLFGPKTFLVMGTKTPLEQEGLIQCRKPGDRFYAEGRLVTQLSEGLIIRQS